MNELRQLAYLDAMGVDRYVSRKQLPGAAPTCRMAIVCAPEKPPVLAAQAPLQKTPGARIPSMPRVDVAVESTSKPTAPGSTRQAVNRPRATEVPCLSLAAIVAGPWLWLEELGTMPLNSEQVWLVQSMARALGIKAGRTSGTREHSKPDVAQFHWPIHTNAQLDLGEEAARAGLAGFIGRKLEQYGCSAVVLMGSACEHWVSAAQLNVPGVSIPSTADILANSALKGGVWRDLQALVVQT